MTDPARAHVKISFDGFELDMQAPIDDVRDVLTILTERLVIAFGKAKSATPSEDKT